MPNFQRSSGWTRNILRFSEKGDGKATYRHRCLVIFGCHHLNCPVSRQARLSRGKANMEARPQYPYYPGGMCSGYHGGGSDNSIRRRYPMEAIPKVCPQCGSARVGTYTDDMTQSRFWVCWNCGAQQPMEFKNHLKELILSDEERKQLIDELRCLWSL